MPTLLVSDLDERPYLTDIILDMFQQAGPGRNHAVCGEPQRMGVKPRRDDLDQTMGVLFVIEDGHPKAAMAICPYSDEQVTLWGPVFREHFSADYGMLLLDNVKAVLRKHDLVSYRVLIDSRNREMRQFYLNAGLQRFEDNILFSRPLDKPTDLSRYPVDRARTGELSLVETMLMQCFPDNGHCSPGLQQRIDEGYIHYLLRVQQQISGCAVISRHQKRSWLSLVCIDPAQRGHGYSHDLLNGIINSEYGEGMREIAFEVLASNQAAVATYHRCGFERQWTASIFTGPL